MRKFLISGILSSFLVMAVSAAEEKKPAQEIGDWWNKSALSYEPMLDPWLYHVEATVSYQKLSGNTEGTIYSTDPMLTLRKGRFSNYLGYKIASQDMDYGDNGSVETKSETLSEDLRCELVDWMFLGAGYRKVSDDLIYVDNRNTYFAGAGFGWTPVKDRLTLGLFVAYGFEDTAYMAVTELPDEDSGGVYVQPVIQAVITKTISFSGKATYLEYANSEMDKRWDVDLGFDIALAPHLYLNLGLNKKYENNIAIRNDPEAEKTTTTQTVGFKLSY